MLCEVAQPIIMKQIIDEGIPNKDLGFIAKQGFIMIFVAIVSLSAGVLGAKFASIAGTGVAAELRSAEMKKIQAFSFKNIDPFSNASLITRMTSDVNNVQNTAIMTMRILARAPMMFLFAIFFAVSINAQLSLVFMVAIPILVLSLVLIISTAFPRFRKLQQATDGINRTLQENFIGIRVVKSFVREMFEKKKLQLTIYAVTIAVMWFGGGLVISGTMTTGDLISFISYITQILMSLMMISFVFVMLTMTKASMDRIFEVLDTNIDVEEPEYPITVDKVYGEVEFDHVHFSYGKQQDEEVLSNISFKIKPGEVFGIIGPTGSGKSSLVQLIPRLYDTTAGTVRVGGHDVRDYRFSDLRQNVSMVLQKNTLFSGTIRENLLWGNPNASEEEMIQAAKYAQAHDFIMEMPEGYDTHVEQGGSNFSGGQKQRLTIARAMLRKPALLILDDSTSAVDTATDSKIREAFFNHLPETTVIIIAQRISSIQGADNILVLDDGKVNGLGTHEELMESNDLYRDIYETQMKGAKGDE